MSVDSCEIEPRMGAPLFARVDSEPTTTRLLRRSTILFAGLIVVHATGVTGSTTYSLLIAASAVLGWLGLRRNQPTLRWPWIAVLCLAPAWALGNALSETSDSRADLTEARSLLPDLFALPGYALLGAALYGIVRARRVHRDGTMLVDGAVLAIGTALVVHHTLIVPTLQLDGAWLPAQLVVSAYPTASIFFVLMAAQLAFSADRRCPALCLLLLGTVGLVVGDVVWAFGEVGVFTARSTLLDIPYMLVPSSFALAMMHPSVKDLGAPDPTPSERHLSRYIAVTVALTAPASLVLLPGSVGPIVILMSVLLCALSAFRVVAAMRAEDAIRSALRYQAAHDELTQLPERSLLIEEIERLLANKPLGAVTALFLDIDRFKHVNDLMGHQAGDELLVAVAQRIGNTVRGDDLVARISGDEFVVITTGLSSSDALRLARRLRATLSIPFTLSCGDVCITVSTGISHMTLQSEGPQISATELVQQADTAMYESKLSRNEITVFTSEMRDRAIRRIDVERRLRSSTDSPDLSVHFQPIVDTTTDSILGFEALLRWTSEGQPISPAEFVPIAEETGLIVPIGAFVLEESCRQLAYWRKNVPGAENLYVSVNLSPRQLVSANIVDRVVACLERHDLAPDALWLEITETVVTEDTAITAAALSGLRLIGVQLALDDFGTGFSSLSGLQFIPVTRLKIDRQFVSGLGDNGANDKLVQCITAVAESFDLDVVAEGVERQDQLDHLRSIGCSLVQGYLYSPAVPAEEVPSMLHEYARRRRPARPHHPRSMR